MPSVVQTDPTILARAIEQRLLTWTSVITAQTIVGDISNVYWVEPDGDLGQKQTGQRDVLLVQWPDQESRNVTTRGAGRFVNLESGFDLRLRSSTALDPRGTRRDWFIAHRPLINALMDAMQDFFPEDASRNALTVYGFVFGTNSAPSRQYDTTTWGYTISSYRYEYAPLIDTTRGW